MRESKTDNQKFNDAHTNNNLLVLLATVLKLKKEIFRGKLLPTIFINSKCFKLFKA